MVITSSARNSEQAREVVSARPSSEAGARSFREMTGKVPLWKRTLDITCLLVALPTVLPLMLCIAAFIKIVSPGPVFFRQRRIGFLGQPFDCMKFRSMEVNADTQVHSTHVEDLIKSDRPMTKLDNSGDKRLIKLGWFLRATGLDELPQLINVLKGEMSLVGPRPCTPSEFALFQAWQRERCRTLPGLTGLWQVSGKNKTTFTEMIKLDIYYAQHSSIWLDLKIMLMTFPVLFSQVQETQTANGGKKP